VTQQQPGQQIELFSEDRPLQALYDFLLDEAKNKKIHDHLALIEATQGRQSHPSRDESVEESPEVRV
jgi:hypothetical protein